MGSYSPNCSTQQSYYLESEGIKEFPRQEKTKGVHLTKPLLYEMLKGLIQEKKDQNYEQ